jgi:hypothetical protein
MTNNRKKKIIFLNILFLLVALGILLILLKAPEESTAKLPLDDIHRPFQAGMSKKEAELRCGECHGPGTEAALPEGHPPPYRCLFCHKRQ